MCFGRASSVGSRDMWNSAVLSSVTSIAKDGCVRLTFQQLIQGVYSHW